MSSRFGDYDDGFELWRDRLWRIDLQRALRTKPALKALIDLRDALQALPEKRLLPGVACFVPFGDDDEQDLSKPSFCAMGAWLHHKRVAAGEPEPEVVEDLASSRFSDEDYGEETVLNIAEAAKSLGMSKTLATHIQWINDLHADWGAVAETEEQRYVRVLQWTLDTIAANPHR